MPAKPPDPASRQAQTVPDLRQARHRGLEAVLFRALPGCRPEPLAVGFLRHSRRQGRRRRRRLSVSPSGEVGRHPSEAGETGTMWSSPHSNRFSADLSRSRWLRRIDFVGGLSSHSEKHNDLRQSGGHIRRCPCSIAVVLSVSPRPRSQRRRSFIPRSRRGLAGKTGAGGGAVHAGRLDRHHRAPGRQPPAGGLGPVGGGGEQAGRRRQHRRRHGRPCRSRRLHHLHLRPGHGHQPVPVSVAELRFGRRLRAGDDADHPAQPDVRAEFLAREIGARSSSPIATTTGARSPTPRPATAPRCISAASCSSGWQKSR